MPFGDIGGNSGITGGNSVAVGCAAPGVFQGAAAKRSFVSGLLSISAAGSAGFVTVLFNLCFDGAGASCQTILPAESCSIERGKGAGVFVLPENH